MQEALHLFELESLGAQLAGTLSRGQSQRLGLARALLADPRVLLLDEPFAGVDPAGTARIGDRLRDLADAGRTLVVSTHDLADASTLGDDVTILRDGRVLAQGAAATLREQLMGSALRVRVRGTGDVLGVVQRLGFRGWAVAGPAVEVDVPDEVAVEDLVDRLVAAGVRLREVTPAVNALQDLYLHLEGGASSAGVRAAEAPSHAR